MDKTKVTKDLANKTLVIERVFDAPKDKVWRAYADKEWYEQWWGPEGWQTTTKEFDFRPGGRIHYGMKCIDRNQGEFYGQESWGLMELETVEGPDKFAAVDHFSDADGTINQDMPTQRLEVELVDEGDGRTRMISRSFLASAEQLEELVKMGMVESFASQMNRLDVLLQG